MALSYNFECILFMQVFLEEFFNSCKRCKLRIFVQILNNLQINQNKLKNYKLVP